MKIQGFLLVFLIVVLGFTGQLQAQSEPKFGKFIISENKNRVFLNWSIVAGNTCDGVQIFRSNDSVNFTQIGEIAGLCGSVIEELDYHYIDSNPVKNKVNYYRLQLGWQGLSPILSIDITDFTDKGYQIRPNPADVETKIYFDNDKTKEYTLSIFNLQGQKIISQNSNDDYFTVNTYAFNSGMYVFTISQRGSTENLQGKILVQH